MLPTVPAWPAYTYVALGITGLFLLGLLLACILGLMRGCVQVLSGAWRGLVAVGQWLCGLPPTSGGSAHFATRREVEQAGLLTTDGVPLAAYDQGRTLREPHGGHVLVMGPPRSWKSTGIVMPALEQFPGSVVCNDLRGELFAKTSTMREAYGSVYHFAPTQADSCALNLMDAIRWGTAFQHGDTQRIVHHLLSPPERQTPPNPFASTAIPVLTAMVTHGHDQGQGSFPGVVQWMLEPLRGIKEKTEELLTSPNPLVRSGARRLADMSERLRASVWNACLEPLAVFEDPQVAANTSHSDVRFDQLLTGLQPTTLYLCPSFSDVRRLSGLLGAFTEQLVAVLGSPEQPPRHPVLLVLDEMANLGYLPELETAISHLQGSGTRVLAAWQNVAQVRQVYGAESPLLASFATQVHYRPNDQATAEHIAGLLGQTTVLRRSASAEVGLVGLWRKSRSEAEVERALLTVDEILRLPQTAAVVVQAGAPPVMARKLGVPPPSTGAKARTFALAHRQGCAVAACVLVVLACLWPALAPVWTAPPVPTLAMAPPSSPLPTVYASVPPPLPVPPAVVPPVVVPEPEPPAPTWSLVFRTSDPVGRDGAFRVVARLPFASREACLHALTLRYEPRVQEAQQSAAPRYGRTVEVQRTEERLTWEIGNSVGQPPARFEAWCQLGGG